MTVYNSDITGVLQPAASSSQAGVVLCNIAEASLPDSLAADDLVKLCKLPAGHQPVDLILETEELDSGGTPAIALSVGILNADENGLVADTNFLTDDTKAQGGGVARADVIDGLGLTESDSDRIIAAKVTTVAATQKAGAMRCKLLYCENG